MTFEVIISPRALNDIEDAIDFYKFRSNDAPLHFITQLESAYNTLKKNPYHSIRYKNVRSLKIKKFPYSLFFTLNEETNFVEVLSCFHVKLNPEKRP